MYKVSRYNHIFKYEKDYIWYNSLNDSLLVFNEKEHKILKKILSNNSIYQNDYSNIVNKLLEWGFLINQNFDELAFIKYKNKLAIYNDGNYWVTINPTLSCNLNCWYCSVNYNKTCHNNEFMNFNTIERIKLHFKYVIENRKCSSIHLDWFGGEPFLCFDSVIEPVSNYVFELCEKYKIPLTIHFTTNATMINFATLEKIKCKNLSFQITLDGDKKRHNLIKNESGKPTYDMIVGNVNLLVNKYKHFIILRINCDLKTLINIHEIINDLKIEDKKLINIDLQKIWQIELTDEYKFLYKEASLKFRKSGFDVRNWSIKPLKFYSCYSDRLNHIAINYDGRIYKCTARNYDESLSIGHISEDGVIITKPEVLIKYFSVSTMDSKECQNCKFLPICFGPCIQKKVEEISSNGKDKICLLKNSEINMKEYLINRVNSSFNI